ncbi:MAG: hypothetical protein AAFR60_00240 [Pseudomonadota bacterium]
MAADLKTAIAAARASDWEAAHSYTQANQGEMLADWLHAILHKMEPDETNARYWYGRCGRSYEDFDDAGAELDALETAAEA